MLVNTKIREALKEIKNESIKYANTPDANKKYFKRILHLFKNNLTEDEQIYVFAVIAEFIHYRSIITDPDNVLMLHNIKLRTYTYIFILIVCAMLFAAVIFKTSGVGENFHEFLSHLFKILTF